MGRWIVLGLLLSACGADGEPEATMPIAGTSALAAGGSNADAAGQGAGGETQHGGAAVGGTGQGGEPAAGGADAELGGYPAHGGTAYYSGNGGSSGEEPGPTYVCPVPMPQGCAKYISDDGDSCKLIDIQPRPDDGEEHPDPRFDGWTIVACTPKLWGGVDGVTPCDGQWWCCPLSCDD